MEFLSPEPLAEVFGVKINHEGGGDVYGTIKVSKRYNMVMYDRKSNNRQCISSSCKGENLLLLTGPPRVISALEWFAIDVDLMHRNSSEEPEDEINVQLGWHIRCQPKYDQPMYHDEDFPGNNGKSVTVFYSVFWDALKATVEVINWGKGNLIGVYGLVAASNSMISGDDYESVLFRVTKDQQEESTQQEAVRPGQPIPLSRSVVAAPLKWDLIVRAELYNQRHNNDLISGIVSFPVELSGTSQKKISGKFSKILVRITWSRMIHD